MKFSGKVGSGPMNEWFNFDGDPHHGSGSYRDTGKTCLGGGMHCPSASRSFLFMLEKCRLDRLLGFQLGLTLLLCCCWFGIGNDMKPVKIQLKQFRRFIGYFFCKVVCLCGLSLPQTQHLLSTILHIEKWWSLKMLTCCWYCAKN